jgi:23S rRNA (uridine2552-2'-O)-methyltransferase
LQLDAGLRLLRGGVRVADLGAAPGGWSQVAASKAGDSGLVVAVDRARMKPLPGVICIRGDFISDAAALARVDEALGKGARFDLVLCDAAPDISGVRAADDAKAAALWDAALAFCDGRLAAGGGLLIKVFAGEEERAFRGRLAAAFAGGKKVRVCRPPACRGESREFYLFASGARKI